MTTARHQYPAAPRVGRRTAEEPVRRRAPRRGLVAWLRRFVYRYGWRAYALPILAAVTVLAIFGPLHRSTEHSGGAGHVPPPNAAGPPVAGAPSTSPAPRPDTGTMNDRGMAMSLVAMTVCQTNTTDQLIMVSISQQHAWMCQHTTLVRSVPVTTGELADDMATPTGSWAIQGKATDQTLRGPGYADHVNYWMPFWGDFGFHDAPWQPTGYGDTAYYKNHGSHGCVHLPESQMAWLYQWAQVGATVTVRA